MRARISWLTVLIARILARLSGAGRGSEATWAAAAALEGAAEEAEELGFIDLLVEDERGRQRQRAFAKDRVSIREYSNKRNNKNGEEGQGSLGERKKQGNKKGTERPRVREARRESLELMQSPNDSGDCLTASKRVAIPLTRSSADLKREQTGGWPKKKNRAVNKFFLLRSARPQNFTGEH